MTARRLQLPNGLTVLLERSAAAPVVALQAWIDAGSADETTDEAGMAHLHEHMLFKGTARRAVGEVARSVEAAGGDINAWTSFDETVYHLIIGRDEVDFGLDVLADMLGGATFEIDELRREVEVVCEEIHRTDDQPSRRLSRALFALAYGDHPYGRPVLGTQQSVRALRREQILSFYERYYRPERTTVVVVGDIDEAAALTLVERHFGSWRRSTPPPPTRQARPLRLQATNGPRLRILGEAVEDARFSLGFSIPDLTHPSIPALDALSVLLGTGDAARLPSRLRRELRLVNDVHAHAYTPRETGLFLVGASAPPEKLAAALSAAVVELRRTADETATESELERIKVLILSDSAYQRETVQGQARKLGFYEVVARDVSFEAGYREAIAALCPDDLRIAARLVLSSAPILAVQGPKAWAESLSAASLGASLSPLRLDESAPAPTVAIPATRQRAPAAAGAVTQAIEGGVEVVTLTSGARLILKPEAVPVVSLRAVAMAGLRSETRRNAGISALFSTVFGTATRARPIPELADAWARLGGSIGGFAGRNAVGLRADSLAEHHAAGATLFVEALTSPAFAAADVERERAVQLERLRTRRDSPSAVAFDQFAAALYPEHPYGQRILGEVETVARLGVADLEAYFSDHLAPNNLCIAVVGGFDPSAIRAAFASLPARAGKTATPPAAPSDVRAATLRTALDKQQSHLIVGGLGLDLKDPRREALDVMSTVLSGQGGRLFLDLRDRQSLAYSVSASSIEGVDRGHFAVHIATHPSKVDTARRALLGHLARLRDEPVTAAELERAQRHLIGTNAMALQRAGARSATLAIDLALGLGVEHHRGYPERLRRVSAADVQDLAQQLLAPALLIDVEVGPELVVSAVA